MIYRFGAYSLDPERLELRDGDDPVTVEPQVFALIAYLIENRHRVLSKGEIFDAVWDGRIVSDATLNTRVNGARRALGDDGKAQAVIKTFPRRGFRFIAEVESDGGDATKQLMAANQIFDKPSIAVLPFENLSGDPEQEYFSDGIAEDIITALSRIRQFFVIARNSSFSYKRQSLDLRDIAKFLGVRYVLEGSVRKSGNRVRISAQLVDGETGNHLWAERYDRNLEDIFEVQDEITQTVVGAIEPEMERAERNRAIIIRPDSLGAWELYHRGTAHLWDQGEHGQPSEIEKALDNFNKCIELDPRFSRAYSAMAYCKFMAVVLGLTEQRAQVLEEGFAAARKAIELDPQDAYAYAHLGGLHFVNRQPEEAVRVCETAIDLNSGSSIAHHWLGMSLMGCGRASEGLEKCRLSVQLEPRNPYAGPAMAWIAIGYLCLESFQETIAWARRALDLPSTQFWANAALVSAYGHLGNQAEAKRAREDLNRRKPNFTIAFVEKTFPLTYPDYLARFIDGLRRAEVPEN